MHVSFSTFILSFIFVCCQARRRRVTAEEGPAAPSTIINEKDAKKFQGKSRLLENCGGTPANIDIYQLRAFGLPRPLRYFVVSNAQDVLRNILLICLRQVRRPAFRHEVVGRKPPPATNRHFASATEHLSSAIEQFHARSRTNCAKW